MATIFTQLLIILAVAEMCSLWRNPLYSGSRKKCECFCGQESRIVGGKKVKDPDMYPFMVAIDNVYVCGGILISPIHVLTAAHCIEEFDPTNKPKVILGSVDIRDPKYVLHAKKIVLHEEYNFKGVINDIGLIILEERVEYTCYMRPICLPGSSRETFVGSELTVVGYGATEENENILDGKLRRVKVNVVNLKECKKIYKTINKNVRDTHLCAGYVRGMKDACRGDSGGPLLASRKGFLILAGIVSWGYGCGKPNFPSVYTAVNKYLDWIKEKVGDECLCFQRGLSSQTSLKYMGLADS